MKSSAYFLYVVDFVTMGCFSVSVFQLLRLPFFSARTSRQLHVGELPSLKGTARVMLTEMLG